LLAQQPEIEDSSAVDLSTDLNHAVQQIPKIIFALPHPNNDGSWQDTGQVVITQDMDALVISGSLITNYEQMNRMEGLIRNSSLL
jgi:hypothetical protein